MGEAEARPGSKWSRVLRWAADRAALYLALTAGATVAAFLGRLHHLLELATHFRVFYLGMALALTVLLLAARSWRWAAVGVVIAALNVWVLVPYYLPRETPSTPPNLRLLVANVLTSNHDGGRLVSLIRDQRPDAIALVEVDVKWLEAVAAVKADYPHAVTRPRNDNFGVALFSKFPISKSQIVALADSEVPAIDAELDVNGRPARLLVVHAFPPGSSNMARVRDAQLMDAADKAQSSPIPVIVCGDFNAAPWSPIFADALKRSGLKEARRGFGLQNTWPVFFRPFMIPLDHCLVSPSIEVRSFKALESTGSDHLPLAVELVIPQAR